MRIDDYNAAKALTDKLKQSLPITVKAGKEFLKTLKQKGEDANPDREFEVDFVGYSGDDGGIMCGLKEPNNPESKEKYVSSITHLKIDPHHPLAAEVQAYQRQRIRKLMLQNSGGFTAELMTIEPMKKKKSAKGFGN
ncbi:MULTISPECIES: hypothetical protein [Calothrix]|uniref:Uncharacterized protein n=2 Tax=Calothrix TaxID=1186 RepID=A0ABR8AAJ6_9CYAN|nr:MULTISPECIES: hypothetical protein [Calothrix]MBD2196824.1 hypothetical protein [Calothrix parietina FACHB-288]MBD2225376.1 hypothetical protein [Calothrix anomala FACHB-343]